MLRLRLRRVGRKHDPSFRIVVTENTAPLKGKYLESIGFYNAVLKKREVNHERAKYWLSKGVQPTDVVHNILVSEGVIDAPKIAVHKRSKKQSEAETPAPEQEEGITDATTAEADSSAETPEEKPDNTPEEKEAKSDAGDEDSSPDTAVDEKKDEVAASTGDKKDKAAEKSDA